MTVFLSSTVLEEHLPHTWFQGPETDRLQPPGPQVREGGREGGEGEMEGR